MSSSKPYEFTGKIHQIGQTQTFPSGFAKRTLVLVRNEASRYPDYAAFDFLRTKSADNTTDLNRFAVGQTVTVRFFVSASESKKSPGSWFASARAVGIEAAGGATALPVAAPLPTSTSCEAEQEEMPF